MSLIYNAYIEQGIEIVEKLGHLQSIVNIN